MSSEKPLSPYSLPDNFRAYVYDVVVLALETKRVDILPDNYNKKTLASKCGIHVLKLDKLSDVQWRDQGVWSPEEFLVFYNEGRGYDCLFKRLRDTFAHGHYWQSKRGWIAVRHRYKTPRDKVENTRLFGNMKISTLRNLVAYLDISIINKN